MSKDNGNAISSKSAPEPHRQESGKKIWEPGGMKGPLKKRKSCDRKNDSEYLLDTNEFVVNTVYFVTRHIRFGW
jgi:hypothetical protein